MKNRILSLLCALAMVMGLLAGCGNSNSTEEDSSTTAESVFTMAFSSLPEQLAPMGGGDDVTSMIRPIFDPLFVETAEGYEYYLAEEVEVADDGVTYTIKLKDGITWSDGTPITVNDILFSISYQEYIYGGSSEYSDINGQAITYNVIDEKTLEVLAPEESASLMGKFSKLIAMPAHVFDNNAENVDVSGHYASTDIVTSGAYTVSEYNADSIVYEAKDDYYRGTVNVEKVVIRTVGDGSSKQVALDNGEISYMRVTTAEELEKYEAQQDNYNVYSIPEARLNYLQINPYSPNDLNDDARKAICLALDIEEIVNVGYGSDKLATAANSFLTPQQSLYNSETEGYKQDLETAKELAKSSGLEGKTLTYIYNADRANMEAIATVVQQQLAQIGVTVKLEGLDSSAFFNILWAPWYGSGLETTWDLGTNGYDSLRGQSGMSLASLLYDEHNGFSQKTIDLALEADGTVNQEEAQKIWDELMVSAFDDCQIYPLVYTNYVMVSQKNVTGLDCNEIVPEFVDWLGINVE